MLEWLKLGSVIGGYLISKSEKVKNILPDSENRGLYGVFLSLISRRFVLIIVLVGLALLGQNSEVAEARLLDYVTEELGIEHLEKDSFETWNDHFLSVDDEWTSSVLNP